MTPIEAKKRAKRIDYLYAKANDLAEINPEQAEAYIQRLNYHKQKILKYLEGRK